MASQGSASRTRTSTWLEVIAARMMVAGLWVGQKPGQSVFSARWLIAHHRSEAFFNSAVRPQMAIRNTSLGMLPVATESRGVSKFSERQRDDLRCQRQPDLAWVNDKPRPGPFAEVLLEGPNPIRHRWTRRRGEFHLHRNQFAASSGNSGTQNDRADISSYARASELAEASIASINFSV